MTPSSPVPSDALVLVGVGTLVGDSNIVHLARSSSDPRTRCGHPRSQPYHEQLQLPLTDPSTPETCRNCLRSARKQARKTTP